MRRHMLVQKAGPGAAGTAGNSRGEGRPAGTAAAAAIEERIRSAAGVE